MNRNNKGFTLTEILSVIVIISLLLLLIVPTIMNGIKNKADDIKKLQPNVIYEVTEEFINTSKDDYPNVPDSTYCIPIQKLIDSGYISDDMKDALTGKEYDKTKSIEVKIDSNGNKTYALSNVVCTEKHSSVITFNIHPDNTAWSTSKNVEINYPDIPGYTRQYYKSDDPNFDCNSVGDRWVVYTPGTSITFNKNGKICARMAGDSGKENINNNSKVVKIDTIKPTCAFNMPAVTGKNGWYVSNVTFSITKTDTGDANVNSGINKWDIVKGNVNPNYNNVGSVTHTADTESVVYYCHVRDRAGNEGNNSKIIKKDTVGPAITFTPNTQVVWIKGGLNVTAAITDATSGLAVNQKVYYAWGKSNSVEPTYSNYISTTNTAGAKSTKIVIPAENLTGQYYLWVKQGTLEDMAGNKNNKTVSKVFKFDNMVPNVDITGNPTEWTSNDVTLHIQASDADSGLAPQPYSFDGGITWTANPNKIYTTNTADIQIWVKDNAGNIKQLTTSVTKIIKSKPSCVSSGGSSSWTNQSVTLVGTCASEGGLSSCNNVTKTYSNKSSVNLTNQSPGKVCDAAGNCTACPADQTVKIDSKAPTCTVSGASTKWTKGNRTITYGCKDTGGSGCATASAKKVYDKTTKVATLNWTIKDKAGNTTNCSKKVNVYVDKTKPRSPKINFIDWDGVKSYTHGCDKKGGTYSNVVCTVNVQVKKGTRRWKFSSNRTYKDDHSLVGKTQSTWTHNGTADKHPKWTDDDIADQKWSWRLDKGAAYVTYSDKWIKHQVRAIDKVGNSGYSTTITIKVKYVN